MTPTARLDDMHLCPISGHGTSPIASASPNNQINFMGAARVAINPVISGDTPIGVPGGYFEFLPK